MPVTAQIYNLRYGVINFIIGDSSYMAAYVNTAQHLGPHNYIKTVKQGHLMPGHLCINCKLIVQCYK